MPRRATENLLDDDAKLYDTDAAPKTGSSCGCFRFRRSSGSKEDKRMQEGLRAVELVNKKHLASASAGWAKLQLPKPSVVLADMHADPYNIDAQLTGLISLRQYTIVAGGKELLDVMLKPGTSDDSTAGCSYSHTEPDQHAAWRGGLAPKIISREEGDGSSGGSSPLSICDSPTQRNGNAPVTDGSDSPGRSNGKAPMAAGSDSPGRGKAKMVAGPQHNTQSNSPLPIRGNSGGGGAPDAQPVDLVDVIVSAMLLARHHPLLQEHACVLLSFLMWEITAWAARLRERKNRGNKVQPKKSKDYSADRRNGLDVDADAGTGGAAGGAGAGAARGAGAGAGAGAGDGGVAEDAAVAQRVRARAYQSGVVSAVTAAMKAHPNNTDVIYSGMLVLWAICHDKDGAEGKQQAAAAGAIELIAAALMQPQPPLCIWNIGRSSLMAIIRGEPALRRRAKRAFPRVTFTYSLFMLGL